MKTVLVTGASGFIGQAVVRRFVRDGWDVIGVVHKHISPWLNEQSVAGKVRLIRADLSDIKTLSPLRYAGSIDVVVHCAGRVTDVGRRRDFFKSIYLGSRNIVKAIKHLSIPRLILISTTDVYGLKDFSGEQEDSLPIAENSRNYYPYYKIATEMLVRKFLAPERFAIVRPGAVWGPGDKTLTPRIVSFIKSFPMLVHFGSWKGRNRWPLAHVDNVAATIFLLANAAAVSGQSINVVDNEYVTLDEFYRALGRILARKTNLRSVYLPRWLWSPIGKAISWLAKVFNTPHPAVDPTHYALYTISSNLNFSNRRMQQLFSESGEKFVSYEEGLRQIAPADVKLRSRPRESGPK